MIKKKKNLSKAKKTKQGFSKIYIGIFILAILLPALIFYFFSKKQNLPPCAVSGSCVKDFSGNFNFSVKEGFFHGEKTYSPKYFAGIIPPKVLGEKTAENKHIYVDLSAQRLYAFEGGKLVYNFFISSGKWGRTPTGDFKIWVKLRYTRMSGGSTALGTYYDLPNVPYVMFFYNNEIAKDRGFSLHGTYWHNNFGHPMSHGCVNMKIEEVEKLYAWASPASNGNTTHATLEDPGTPITIYGEAPQE